MRSSSSALTDSLDKLKVARCRICERLQGPEHLPRDKWKASDCRCPGGIGADQDLDAQHLCRWFRDVRHP